MCAVSCAVFHLNGVPFSLDQLYLKKLHDLSMHRFKLFVSSQCALLLCTQIILLFTYISFCYFCLYNQKFNEPVACNPLILIFQVLQYSMQIKQPCLRSALIYWEDNPYSKIELAGGPFTTKQVEDVKTFFYITRLSMHFCSHFCKIPLEAHHSDKNETGNDPHSYFQLLLWKLAEALKSNKNHVF